MALNLFGKNSKKAAPASKQGSAEAAPPKPADNRLLLSLFDNGIVLKEQREQLLNKGLTDGNLLFEDFNESRLKLAFEAFSEDMKHALYEVLFFLHVNDPKFTEVKFKGVTIEKIYGVTREREHDATACLYLEDAPAGVAGIDALSPLFKEKCDNYLQETFGQTPSSGSVQDFCPFVSVASLGSIGTVGHKPIVSDLDIQVQYELEPFKIDVSAWNDEQLQAALKKEVNLWAQRIRVKKKLTPEAMKNPQVKINLQKMAMGQVKKQYPLLFQYSLRKQGNLAEDLAASDGASLRQNLLHEMMTVIKRAEQRKYSGLYQAKEDLLKQRVQMIQDYIEKKFPKAEIYLFVCDNPSYRQGRHGSTLESKEASGTAYEMILTYDVLMPGIQFTPMIPTHFILPKMINNSPSFYDRIIDYIRFSSVEMYGDHTERLVNLGATPSLDLRYILCHGGAVYWEAFKAASGNLAKAVLNLFRIEMLHEPKYLVMIIEMMKSPDVLDQFIDTNIDMKAADSGEYGLRTPDLLEIEDDIPMLKKDPWWTKYKILKIAFAELSYLQPEERKRISRIIDLCFGLHVKVSEVFVKPGDTRTFESYRERFLLNFLNRAFPTESPQRTFLEHINVGETKAVIEFEDELKFLFQESIDRVLKIQSEKGLPDESNQKEFEIWYHYYKKNFEPAPNVVRRSILHHLKVPRLRIQAGYQDRQGIWLFRSLQTESKLGKRFDTFGVMDHLPDEIDLLKSPSFLYGLSSCILNSYYGSLDQGSLKERNSVIEFDSGAMKFGDRLDTTYAYIRPDNIDRLVKKITDTFPERSYHYMDCVNVPKYYMEAVFFLHMMKFGQISILYRDHLTNWYLDEIMVPELREQEDSLFQDYKKTFSNKGLVRVLKTFFEEHKIDLTAEETKVSYWLNPNSAETPHSAQKVVAKEDDLGKEFGQMVMKIFQAHKKAQSDAE